MKKLICLISLVVFACALPALAANPFLAEQRNGSIKKAELPTCESKIEGASFSVNDCVSTVSCATTATPGFVVRMTCDYTGSAWAWRPLGSTVGATDLSAYAPLAGADFTGPVSVTTSPSNSWSVNDAEFEAWAHLAVDEDTITGTVSCLFEDDGGPDGECKMQATNSDGFGASVSMYPGSVSVQASTVSNSAFASIDGNAGIMSFTATNSIGIQGCDNWGPRANYSTISDPAECDTFFDTTLHAPCYYNGATFAWVLFSDGLTECTGIGD